MNLHRATLATPDDLRPHLMKALRADTSSNAAKWGPENPTYGHCAVVALVVQDLFGGEVVWAEARHPDGTPESHYFNKIAGIEWDLTRDQFPDGTLIPLGIPKCKSFGTTRDYVLSFQPTADRYRMLRHRLGLEEGS